MSPADNATDDRAPAWTLRRLADGAVLVKLGERIDPVLSARTLALAARIVEARFAGVVDVVPAYASVLLVFDPDAPVDVDAIERALVRLAGDAAAPAAGGEPRLIEIDTVYGGVQGPDLAAVAAFAGIGEDEVVARHVAVEYRVAMLGFRPGFPYLLGLDPLLAMPRRATPRPIVPAGSVAIGGPQTGIYPSTSPGGWQLIGRTELRLFDPHANPPTLLAPGDRVRFRAVAR